MGSLNVSTLDWLSVLKRRRFIKFKVKVCVSNCLSHILKFISQKATEHLKVKHGTSGKIFKVKSGEKSYKVLSQESISTPVEIGREEEILLIFTRDSLK